MPVVPRAYATAAGVESEQVPRSASNHRLFLHQRALAPSYRELRYISSTHNHTNSFVHFLLKKWLQ